MKVAYNTSGRACIRTQVEKNILIRRTKGKVVLPMGKCRGVTRFFGRAKNTSQYCVSILK